MSQPIHTPTPWGYDDDGFDSAAAQDFDADGYSIFPLDKDGMACGHICDLSGTQAARDHYAAKLTEKEAVEVCRDV